MSLFSRGGNGPTEGRCGPSEGGWSAQGHMQWFFPCPCSPVFAGLLCTLTKWVSHTHVWCRGKLEHTQKNRLHLSRKQSKMEQKFEDHHVHSEGRWYITYQQMLSRCRTRERPRARHGILVTGLQCPLIFPTSIHKPGSPFCGFWMLNGASKTPHTTKSLNLHPIL